MFKKWWFGFCQAITISMLVGLLGSLISPNVQIKLLYYLFCVAALNQVFDFFTFELKLFSKHLWVRRAITMCFSIVTILTLSSLFGYGSLTDKRSWLVYGITFTIMVLVLVFAYYVADKIEKRNLAAINQKLANGNMNANKK